MRDLHSAGSMDRDARRYKRIKDDKERTETSGFVSAERWHSLLTKETFMSLESRASIIPVYTVSNLDFYSYLW